jgi:lipopolysaccharide export system protein LptA
VLFMHGETLGRSGRVTYLVRGSRVVLEDEAVLTIGGTSLLAERVEYLRRQGRIFFPAGCRVVRGDRWVEAPVATMDLDEEDGSPARVSLEGGVVISDPGSQEGGSLSAWAEKLVATRDRSGNWQVAAATPAAWITITMGPSAGVLERTLKTQHLAAVVAPEGLLSLRTSVVTCLREVPVTGDVRTAESRSARVWFAGGVTTDIELVGAVDVSGQGLHARGARARLVSQSGIAMLYGDPDGPTRALVESDRGRVTSDQVQIFDRDQRIEARGNVQGQMEGVSILGSGGEGDGQPMHFAAGVLDITEQGKHYRLREGARVWQGRRLLIADDIAYVERDEVVDASGHVRATFPADQLASGASPNDDVVVVSRALRYDRPGRQAVFTGSVRYSDPDHVLQATELRASFDGRDTITEIEATGDVEIEELSTGRTLQAQQATRDVAAGVIHATGSPVRLTDATGTSVSSSSLTWNEADGSVTVAGGTETVYYPEEEP